MQRIDLYGNHEVNHRRMKTPMQNFREPIIFLAWIRRLVTMDRASVAYYIGLPGLLNFEHLHP